MTITGALVSSHALRMYVNPDYRSTVSPKLRQNEKVMAIFVIDDEDIMLL